MKGHFFIVGLLVICFSFFACSGVSAQGYQNRRSGRTNTSGSDEELQAFKEEMQKKSAAHMEKVNQEAQDFLKTLSGKSREEILDAVRDYKTDYYNKNCAFREEMQQERMGFFNKRFDANPNMSQEMKDRMVSRLQQQYEELQAFHVQKHAENLAYIDQIEADTSLQGQEMMQAIQEFFQSQKDDAREFMEQSYGGYQNR